MDDNLTQNKKHGHNHSKQPDLEDQPITYYKLMAEALAGLLIEKGVITADELREQMEEQDSRSPIFGGRLIARAWLDSTFKNKLIADVNSAAAEMGIDAGDIPIRGLENTSEIHNVVVCTLCSCYPRSLIGLPPEWYKSRAYRSRAVREPRKVLAEFGTIIPDNVEVRVHDSTADLRFFVIPNRPEGIEALDEGDLAQLVTRDSMIGVANVKSPKV